MKRWLALWLVFALSSPLRANPTLQSVPDLKVPSGSETIQQKKIESVALAWWLKNRGLLAEEGSTVAGYFTVARPIKGFADRGDKVWEVRIEYFGSQPTGVLWINEKSKKVIALGLDQS